MFSSSLTLHVENIQKYRKALIRLRIFAFVRHEPDGKKQFSSYAEVVRNWKIRVFNFRDNLT